MYGERRRRQDGAVCTWSFPIQAAGIISALTFRRKLTPLLRTAQPAIKAPTRTVKLLRALAFVRAKNNTAADQLARRCLRSSAMTDLTENGTRHSIPSLARSSAM